MRPAKTFPFLKKHHAYGGAIAKTRAGRAGPRPISTSLSMHLVLRSTLARGPWALNRRAHRSKIGDLIISFAKKNAVKLYSFANAGNHLHLHFRVKNRADYIAFIRGLTAAIAMAVTGQSRWKKVAGRLKFWDQRPFTKYVLDERARQTLERYIEINHLEGRGHSRISARFHVG